MLFSTSGLKYDDRTLNLFYLIFDFFQHHKYCILLRKPGMNYYFKDVSDLSSKNNCLLEGFDSKSTLDANPVTELRKLE